MSGRNSSERMEAEDDDTMRISPASSVSSAPEPPIPLSRSYGVISALVLAPDFADRLRLSGPGAAPQEGLREESRENGAIRTPPPFSSPLVYRVSGTTESSRPG